jgi:hypothetical protein
LVLTLREDYNRHMVVAIHSLAALPFGDVLARIREKSDSLALEKCLGTVGLEIVVHKRGKMIVAVSRMGYSRLELVAAVHHIPVHEVALVKGLASYSFAVVAVAERAAAEAQEWADFAVDRQTSLTWTWRWGKGEDSNHKVVEAALHQQLVNWYFGSESSLRENIVVAPCSSAEDFAAVQMVLTLAVPN